MEPRPQTPATDDRRHTAAALALVLVLLVLPLAGTPPFTNPNELVRIELTTAMALWASVDLESPAHIYGLSEDVARHQGRILADKAPGLSMAAVPVVWAVRGLLPSGPGTDLPAYWPLRHLLTFLLVSTAAGLGCFVVAFHIPETDSKIATSLALIACLATPMWTYGTVFFSHAPAAALMAAAWLLLLAPKGSLPTVRASFLGGLAAGFAVTTEYPTILLAVVAMATLAARRPPLRTLGGALAGVAIGGLPMLIYHHIAFGAPWITGYAFKADPGFEEIHTTGLVGVALPTVEGLWGVLFGASRGLFFYSPLLLLAPVGMWLMFRRDRWRDVAPLIVAIGLYVMFAAGFVDWQAGWCSAARHLIPAIPLLLIPTMVAIVAMVRDRWTLILVSVLVAVSATRAALTVAISPLFPPEVTDPLRQLVAPSLRDGIVAPNLASSFLPIPAPAVLIAASALAAGALIWALIALAPARRRLIALVFLLAVLGQLGALGWQSLSPNTQSEAFRARWLDHLGHTGAAHETVTGLP